MTAKHASSALAFTVGAALLFGHLRWARAVDTVVHRCTVFAHDTPIGEVRLAARDRAVVVQTLLQTVLMRRVVAEIRKKEETNWPSDRRGAESSRQYVAGLERVQRSLWEQRARSTRGPNPPQRLAIEFVHAAGKAWVSLGTFEASSNPPRLDVSALRELERIDLDAGYIAENIRLILADACGLGQQEIDRLLDNASQQLEQRQTPSGSSAGTPVPSLNFSSTHRRNSSIEPRGLPGAASGRRAPRP